MRLRWRLHHSIHRTRKPMLHANITALCLIERKLLPMKVLNCGNRNFRPFLALWPWPDDLHSEWRYVACATMNFLLQSFRKLSSDRHTDRQTRPKLYTTPLRGWSITATYTTTLFMDGDQSCYRYDVMKRAAVAVNWIIHELGVQHSQLALWHNLAVAIVNVLHLTQNHRPRFTSASDTWSQEQMLLCYGRWQF